MAYETGSKFPQLQYESTKTSQQRLKKIYILKKTGIDSELDENNKKYSG